MSAVEWRPVLGYEGFYEVSSEGDVKSLARTVPHARWGSMRINERILKRTFVPRNGRYVVSLRRDGIRKKTRLVHHIATEAFHGPRPPGLHACHNDGCSTNDQAGNLRWDTPAGNMRDRVKHGTHPQASKTHCKQGHEFTAANTRVFFRSGARAGQQERICLACRRAAEARRPARSHVKRAAK